MVEKNSNFLRSRLCCSHRRKQVEAFKTPCGSDRPPAEREGLEGGGIPLKFWADVLFSMFANSGYAIGIRRQLILLSSLFRRDQMDQPKPYD